MTSRNTAVYRHYNIFRGYIIDGHFVIPRIPTTNAAVCSLINERFYGASHERCIRLLIALRVLVWLVTQHGKSCKYSNFA